MTSLKRDLEGRTLGMREDDSENRTTKVERIVFRNEYLNSRGSRKGDFTLTTT